MYLNSKNLNFRETQFEHYLIHGNSAINCKSLKMFLSYKIIDFIQCYKYPKT